MTMRTIIWKELKERPTALIASLLAIILSVTALVAIRNVTIFSEQEVAGKLDKLGANVLILPAGVTLQDYYSADMHQETIPEEHVAELALAGLTGVEAITPKLCVPTKVDGRNVILTGILPQSEIQKMNAWSGGGMLFKKHEGCKAKINVADENQDAPEALAERRALQHLNEAEVILGSDFASANTLKAGDQLELLGEKFDVLKSSCDAAPRNLVRPEAGYFLALKGHLPTFRPVDSADAVEDRGFACAVGTDDGENRLLFDGKTDAINGTQATKGDGQVVNTKEVRFHYRT